jgi:methyltransferase (TIGR00027 family)
MESARPSQTALSSAAARAAHLLVDHEPHLFRDKLAASLLGGLADEMIGYHRTHGDHLILSGTRALTTTRGRYTEEHLTKARAARYIVLGAGLDTFAYRLAPDAGIDVIEVDHPATLEWKRALLATAGITVPETLTFLAADFESGAPALRHIPPVDGGPGNSRPTVVSWLGVTMYLTREAIEATLAEVARLGPGTELIMEYALPPELRDPVGEAYAEFAAQVVSDRGEPYITFLHPDDVTALLKAQGFHVAEHIRMQDTVPPAQWSRSDALRPFDFFQLVRATVTGTGR